MEELIMAKFCTSCGAQLDDNATFCTSCGAQVGNAAAPSAAPQPQGMPQQPQQSAGDAVKETFNKAKEAVNVDAIKDSLSMENIKNLKTNPNKTTIIALGCIALVVIILIIILYNLIFAHPYKGTLNDYYKGIAQGDGELLKGIAPKCQIEYLEDKDKYVDDYFDDEAGDAQKTLEAIYGDDVKISYSIKDEKALSDKKLSDARKELKEMYDAKDVEVTKGYKVTAKLTIKGDDDEQDDTIDFEVYKVDGDWCILDDSEVIGYSSLISSSLKNMDLSDLGDLEDILG